MAEYREQVALEKLRNYAGREMIFQFSEWRDACDIPAEEKVDRNRLWNLMRRLKRDEVVEEMPTDRKRHKYYKVANVRALTEMMASENGASAPAPKDDEHHEEHNTKDENIPAPGSGIGRLSRLEREVADSRHQLDDLAEMQAKLDAKVEALESQVSERFEDLSAQMSRLIAIWS